jgi:uncharacterized protein YkwD
MFLPNIMLMLRVPSSVSAFPASLLLSLLLTACGGGGDSGGNAGAEPGTPSDAPAAVVPPPDAAPAPAPDPGAPALTGDSATDGLNWFNYRRQQLGLQVLQRNPRIDAAAHGHSNYQRINDTITHDQDPTKPGFTGVKLFDRLIAANYRFTQGSYAYGEVISATTDSSGVNAAEALIAAIYHRFLVFEPIFAEAGAAAATVPGGYMYFTTNFTANGLDYGKALPRGALVAYPLANQTGVPVNFFSDFEVPDPVPNRNEVGYPVSVHANIDASITVQDFTIQQRGGTPLETVTVNNAPSGSSEASAVSIVPLNPLRPATTYDVRFSGVIEDSGGTGMQRQTPVTLAWSFTTR